MKRFIETPTNKTYDIIIIGGGRVGRITSDVLKEANLSTTIENVQAAESVIRDVDMAAEMSTFTKNQILLQAGTAMLAQANGLPNNVLTLLR